MPRCCGPWRPSTPPATPSRGWRLCSAANKIELQKLVYYDIRAAVRPLGADVHPRHCQGGGSLQARQGKQPTFPPAWGHDLRRAYLLVPARDRASLLTLDGRVEVPFRFGAYQEARLDRIRGQADLLYRDGTFYLVLYGGRARSPRQTRRANTWAWTWASSTSRPPRTANSSTMRTGPKHAHVNQVRARYCRFRPSSRRRARNRAKRLLRSAVDGRSALHGCEPLSSQGHCAARRKALRAGSPLKTSRHPRAHQRSERLQAPAESAAQLGVLPTARLHCLQGGSGWRAVVLVNPPTRARPVATVGTVRRPTGSLKRSSFASSCGFSAHADLNAAVNIRRAAVIPPDAAPLAG